MNQLTTTPQPEKNSTMWRRLPAAAAIMFLGICGMFLTERSLAQSKSTAVTYTISNAASTPTILCEGASCTLTGYTVTGPGSCGDGCTSGAPTNGNFTFSFSVKRTWPSDPFRPKSGTGSFDVTWSDATTTQGDFVFSSRDGKGAALKGDTTGGTSPFYPPSPCKGFWTFPSDPLVGGPSTIIVTIFPPAPIR